MTLTDLAVNLVLALLLYIANGIIGKWKTNSNNLSDYSSFGFHDISNNKFSSNYFQMIIHPAIYLAIACAILQHFSLDEIARDLWLLVPFYWLLRLLHICIWNLTDFKSWRNEGTAFIISLLLGEGTLFYIIRPLIDDGKTIFIDLEQFRDAFWFAVFTYLAAQVWNISKKNLTGEELYPSSLKSDTVMHRYDHFRWKYDAFIESILSKYYIFEKPETKAHFLCLLYSIMIYEDYNRPPAIRTIEYIQKLICWHSTMSLGIMQFQTNKLIGDKTSIQLAIRKLYAVFASSRDYEKIYLSIKDYNSSDTYYIEVLSIYDILRTHLGLATLGEEF